MDPVCSNSLVRQCLSLPELCPAQLSGLRTALPDLAPFAFPAQLHTVLLTGCGDSYFAALAAVPGFRKLAFGPACIAHRCIDISRGNVLFSLDPASTLVVGISSSGTPARIAEALVRAGRLGFHTLALTNAPTSRAAQSAASVFNLHTPSFPEGGPGLWSYFSSLLGIWALAAHLAQLHCKSSAVLDGLFAAVQQYTDSFFVGFSPVDAQMQALALQWKDMHSLELIGDERENATAGFAAAKLAEAAGLFASVSDSEDWCHVNFLALHPQNIPTIVVANHDARNRSRIGETLHQSFSIGRPTLLVSDAPASYYGISHPILECLIARPPEGYEFLSPLLAHLPLSLLSAHLASVCQEPFFRGPLSPQRLSASMPINRTSKIVLYEKESAF